MTTPAPDSQPAFDAEVVEARRVEIADRLEVLHQRIERAGGSDVTLLPVSKGHPVEAVVAGLAAGLVTCGENYAQELVAKADALDQSGIRSPEWHFIGQVQTNKVRLVADRVSMWQSVDRLKVAREIANRAPGASVLVQVNLADDPGKGGCSFDELDGLVEAVAELDLVLAGLMGVGTAADEFATASGFSDLRRAVDRFGLTQCSMGMSADLELAIANGATMVRVGSDVFGPRPMTR